MQVCRCFLAELFGLFAGIILSLKNELDHTLLFKNKSGINRERSSVMVLSSPGIWSHHGTMLFQMQISAISLNRFCKSVLWRFALHLFNIHTTGSLSHKMFMHLPLNLSLQHINSTAIAANSFHWISLSEGSETSDQLT